MNSWSLTVAKGDKKHTHHGALKSDKYRALVTNSSGPKAKVSMNVSESYDYSSIRVGASVTLTCDQNTRTIDRAGQLALEKATELMKAGFATYGLTAGPLPEGAEEKKDGG